jgi:hypothetical protein
MCAETGAISVLPAFSVSVQPPPAEIRVLLVSI